MSSFSCHFLFLSHILLSQSFFLLSSIFFLSLLTCLTISLSLYLKGLIFLCTFFLFFVLWFNTHFFYSVEIFFRSFLIFYFFRVLKSSTFLFSSIILLKWRGWNSPSRPFQPIFLFLVTHHPRFATTSPQIVDTKFIDSSLSSGDYFGMAEVRIPSHFCY